MTSSMNASVTPSGVLVITPNPAVDVTYDIPPAGMGGTIRVQRVQRRAGGKGLNVARALAALDVPVTTLQPVGGSIGRIFSDALKADRLAAHNVPIAGETRLTVTLDDRVEHPTVLAEPGPLLTDDDWRSVIRLTEAAAPDQAWVVIAGSFPPGTREEHVAELVHVGHRAGALVAVDTSGRMLNAMVDAGADLVKANEREAIEATGCAGPFDAAEDLARCGARVIISRGEEGILLRDHVGTVVTQPALRREIGNPTGAGDAATAGFLAAVLAGCDTAESLRWAAALGAAVVRMSGEGGSGWSTGTALDFSALVLDGFPLSPPRKSPINE